MASWTVYQIYLAILMVVTGSINTIATKYVNSLSTFVNYYLLTLSLQRWGDRTESPGRDGVTKTFDHPFVQATGMILYNFV